MNSILETERLILREFNSNDAPFILALLNSEGWLKFIGDRNVKTEQEAIKYLENGPLKSYAMNSFGLWMVEKKVGAVPIGMCGIIKREYLEHPDIGFAFLPEFNGKGYAREAATATLAFAKSKLNLSIIDAITVAGNARSIGLLEKIGLSYLKPIWLPGDGEELLLYRTSSESDHD